MKAIDFIKAIHEVVVEEGLESYKEILQTTTTASDDIWNTILPIYKSLSEKEKTVFLAFIRLVEVDTISNLLGSWMDHLI
jgi:hypothetical protein